MTDLHYMQMQLYIYYEIGRHENRLAKRLREGLAEAGLTFCSDSPTNQVFPVLPVEVAEELHKEFFFYDWAERKDGMTPVRLVTGW